MKRSSTIVRQSSDGNVSYVKHLVKQRTEKELAQFKKELSIDDHIIPLKKLVERYDTDLQNGLTRTKANELLKTNGPNCLVPSATKSRWMVLAEFVFGGFSGMLWIGAVLTFTGYLVSKFNNPDTNLDQIYLGTVLVMVVLITGFFGFYQESKNTEIMEGFKKMVPKYANVIRDGQLFNLPTEELVVGDLVDIQAGDCVPADLRITESKGLKVDNSSLTGESEPLSRSVLLTDNNPLETANLVFFSTNVVEGLGTGVVIATGDNTFIGHIAGLTSGIEPVETPIKKEIKNFIKLITALAIVIGVSFFIISIIIGYHFFDAFVFLIAIIVANVPEGLLVTLTACLTLTAKRMARRNCLVKNLQAIETLGSTSVICSDKTGTLTQNRMTVSHMYYDGDIVDVLTDPEMVAKSNAFNMLTRVAIFCNRADFKPDQQNIAIQDRQVIGDASETAVLKCMERLVGNAVKIRLDNPKLIEIPFNSTNKYQLSIHLLEKNAGQLLVMKGAPERVLDRCSTYNFGGSSVTLTDTHRKRIGEAISRMGNIGERVLGFADFLLPPDKYPVGFKFDVEKSNFPMSGLRFVGLMSMIDPPRPQVPGAVAKCKSAGIRVIMVTGDHPITAAAIARKVGILSSENETIYDIAIQKNISVSAISEGEALMCKACVVSGSELRTMPEEKLHHILQHYKEIVFARTSPQQKLSIVEACQNLGAIVAVTGDGVNDSPALRKGDIGVAMGISGSDVSKDAADMIILDDNFSSIVTGIEEGRLIFDNLKKSIAYTLTSNVPEIIPFILFVTLDIPQALSVMAILVIDVGTDIFPAISLAYEKAEADIMKRKPRQPKKDPLVNTRLIGLTYLQIGMIQACAGFFSFFFMMAQHGFYYDKLIGIRRNWEASYINDLEDSFGQEWTYLERMFLQRKCNSAFFISIVVTQVADLIIAKTRRLSIFQQGMTNWVCNVAIFVAVGIACLVVYCPGLNSALQFEAIEWYFWLPPVPFALMIIVYDETRRLIIRRRPGGWVERETYY